MKLHMTPTSANLFTSHGNGYVEVKNQRYEKSLIVLPDEVIADWAPASFEALAANDFAPLLATKPELVLVGTGAKLRFPKPELLRPLIEARVGYEIMDVPALCRTYNVLVAEGRRVAAAVLIA
ncbi:MAG TPA: Mth938-like domain-containing protein [Burkholderiales bacterium]|nr:Mth938-like domain-containing protein [Burkholderiales bacterium]